MISKEFYNSKNLIKQYLGGKVSHYPIKDASVTLKDFNYRLVAGDSLQVIAEGVFGRGMDSFWPYLADNNRLNHPDDWTIGDNFKLPLLIIKDTDNLSTKYANAKATTTTV